MSTAINGAEGATQTTEGLSLNMKVALSMMVLAALLVPTMVMAGTSGAEFQGVYDFIYDAATGYLGRAIAITGGVIGLGIGAATGKPLPAIIGIVLAIFGSLGPTIIDTIFASGLI